MIRYYKEEICNNGIAIESFKGPNGGYFLIDKINYYTSINKYDVQLLKLIYTNLKENKFRFLDKYNQLIGKIEKINNISNERSKYISNININSIDDLENILLDAIKKKDQIEIIYLNIDGSYSNRIIHPLQLFRYNDKKYVTAYCQLRGDIRHFELDRIEKIK